MNKKIKSLFSLAIAICMLFSLAAFNVTAAPTVQRNAIITVSESSGVAEDEITVSITLDGTANIMALQYDLLFDSNVFEADATLVTEDFEKPVCFDGDWWSNANMGSIMRPQNPLYFAIKVPVYNVTPGKISLAGAGSAGVAEADNEENALIGKFILKVKADAPVGSTTFSLSETSYTADEGGSGNVKILYTADTFTVEEAPEEVDTTALEAAIAEAEAALVGAVEGTAVGEYAVGSIDTLEDAIDVANGVLDDADATQAEVDAAVATLNLAIEAFNNAIVTGAAIKVGSAEVDEGMTVSVDISVKDITGAKGFGFGLEFDPTVLEFVSITDSQGLFDSKFEVDDELADEGKVGLAAVTNADVTAEDEYVVIATVSFIGLAEGESDIDFIKASYSKGVDFNFDTKYGGKITVNEVSDPNLPAAIAAVTAFENAANDAKDADDIAAARGLGETAQDLVDALEDGAVKTGLQSRIDAANTTLDNLEADLAKDAALAAINAGTADADDFALLADEVVAADIEDYKNAVSLFREYIEDELVLADVQTVVDAVNDFDEADKGKIVGNPAKYEVSSAVWVRDVYISAIDNPTMEQLLKADMDSNGKIEVNDVMEILKKVAKEQTSSD